MAGKHWIIVIIILVAGYQLFTGLSDLTSKESIDWTEEDRTMLIEKCIDETGNDGILYPKIAREYCECGHDLLLSEMTKSEYLKLIKRPTEEQIKIGKPIFQDCLTTYEDKLKALESDEWTEDEYQLMVQKCVENSGENSVNHPAITREYCECSRAKMIENISKSEMAELFKKSMAEQNEQVNPLVGDCLTEFEKALNLANE